MPDVNTAIFEQLRKKFGMSDLPEDKLLIVLQNALLIKSAPKKALPPHELEALAIIQSHLPHLNLKPRKGFLGAGKPYCDIVQLDKIRQLVLIADNYEKLWWQEENAEPIPAPPTREDMQESNRSLEELRHIIDRHLLQAPRSAELPILSPQENIRLAEADAQFILGITPQEAAKWQPHGDIIVTKQINQKLQALARLELIDVIPDDIELHQDKLIIPRSAAELLAEIACSSATLTMREKTKQLEDPNALLGTKVKQIGDYFRLPDVHWVRFLSDHKEHSSGWKLHVSVKTKEGQEALAKLALDYGLRAFKFAQDPDHFQHKDFAQAGKTAVFYHSEKNLQGARIDWEQFIRRAEMIVDLHGGPGVEVQRDRKIPGAKATYYRNEHGALGEHYVARAGLTIYAKRHDINDSMMYNLARETDPFIHIDLSRGKTHQQPQTLLEWYKKIYNPMNDPKLTVVISMEDMDKANNELVRRTLRATGSKLIVNEAGQQVLRMEMRYCDSDLVQSLDYIGLLQDSMPVAGNKYLQLSPVATKAILHMDAPKKATSAAQRLLDSFPPQGPSRI